MHFVILTGQVALMIEDLPQALLFFLGDCLIVWSAKKQTVDSRSSTKEEYRLLSLTTAKLYWLCMLFKELSEKVLNCDILIKFISTYD
jgi:hypothetical protein